MNLDFNNAIIGYTTDAREEGHRAIRTKRTVLELQQENAERDKHFEDNFEEALLAEMTRVAPTAAELKQRRYDHQERQICGSTNSIWRATDYLDEKLSSDAEATEWHEQQLAELHRAAGALLKRIEALAGREWTPPTLSSDSLQLDAAGGYPLIDGAAKCWLNGAPLPASDVA